MPLGITQVQQYANKLKLTRVAGYYTSFDQYKHFKANEVTKIHDEYYEESRYNTKSIEAFYQWCKK